ncbi:mechanosensitive ion channel family protein [uncultured Desulfovibrio sp.]|uniref:mechanosensitive ion channel family protein n=1 Tax=uncultured Desulfovibrio sp. TaxID=167968 RepID=UPI00265D24CD|nr:mechanosensitive ion channel domain-containing protein [uncultured Desulfovibrio sp.]
MQVGDVVEVGTTTGRVRKISVRATIVETYDNAVIYVPNSEFVSTRLINWTRNSRTVRRDVVVGVAYGSDTGLVMKLLASVANNHSDILKYPAPVVLFSNFGASTLDFTLRFWVRDYDVSVKTASELLFEIDQLFRKNNIEIAFPQMDVHIKDMPPRAKSPRDMATRPTAALPDAPADRRAARGSTRPQRPLRNRKPRPGGKLQPRPAADDDIPAEEDRQLTA